jgi:hypothetical protein
MPGDDGSGGCSICALGEDDNGFPVGSPALSGGGGGSHNFAPSGMPIWKVSEPYISLHLYDQPMGYQPGLGPPISFAVAYQQRGSPPVANNLFNLVCSTARRM